jgi:hypothetical protein
MEVSVIKEFLKGLILEAEKHIPGATGQEKEDWCVEMTVHLVELGDNFIPKLGQWMDLPVVDGLERYIVTLAVRWAYAAVKVGVGIDPAVQAQVAAQIP